MKPRKYEQGWERDDRIADFPEWVEEAEYETEMYRKHGLLLCPCLRYISVSYSASSTHSGKSAILSSLSQPCSYFLGFMRSPPLIPSSPGGAG